MSLQEALYGHSICSNGSGSSRLMRRNTKVTGPGCYKKIITFMSLGKINGKLYKYCEVFPVQGFLAFLQILQILYNWISVFIAKFHVFAFLALILDSALRLMGMINVSVGGWEYFLGVYLALWGGYQYYRNKKNSEEVEGGSGLLIRVENRNHNVLNVNNQRRFQVKPDKES